MDELASSQIETSKSQSRWRRLIKSIGSTTWSGTLDLHHRHIQMSYSLGLIFSQRKLGTWKSLIRPSVDGTTRMPHPCTIFKKNHQGCCGLILHNGFLIEPCTHFAKMSLVQREGWPWGHANAFTIQCAWLIDSLFVDFVPSTNLLFTSVYMSFLVSLSTCHLVGRRTL